MYFSRQAFLFFEMLDHYIFQHTFKFWEIKNKNK